jgi:hypothetical protein
VVASAASLATAVTAGGLAIQGFEGDASADGGRTLDSEPDYALGSAFDVPAFLRRQEG